MFSDLIKKTPESSTGEEAFKASCGWFEKFKRKTRIHSVVRHRGTASSGVKAAENFISILKKLVNFGGYLPQQIFNYDETSLFWKKMPK